MESTKNQRDQANILHYQKRPIILKKIVYKSLTGFRHKNMDIDTLRYTYFKQLSQVEMNTKSFPEIILKISQCYYRNMAGCTVYDEK